MHIKPRRILVGKRLKGNFYGAIVRHNKGAQECKPTKEARAAFFMQHEFLFRHDAALQYLRALQKNAD